MTLGMVVLVAVILIGFISIDMILEDIKRILEKGIDVIDIEKLYKSKP